MADLAKIQFKRSTSAGTLPTVSSLSAGELVMNLADSRIWSTDGTKLIEFGLAKGGTIGGPLTVTNNITTSGGGILQASDGNLYLNKSGATGWIDNLFLRKDQSDTITGGLTITGSIHINGDNIFGKNNTYYLALSNEGTGTADKGTWANPNGYFDFVTVSSGTANVTIRDGAVTAGSFSTTGNVVTSADNTAMIVGNNKDIGLVKKNSSMGKLVVGSSNTFTVSVSPNSAIGVLDNVTDIFQVQSDGDIIGYKDISATNASWAGYSLVQGGFPDATTIPSGYGLYSGYNYEGQTGTAVFVNNTNGLTDGTGQFLFVTSDGSTLNEVVKFDSSGNIISNGAITSNSGTSNFNSVSISGNLTTAATIKSVGIELTASTPYIDFHYNNTTTDYNVRLINDANGQLTATGIFHVGGNLNAGANLRVSGTSAVTGVANFNSSVHINNLSDSNKAIYYTSSDNTKPVITTNYSTAGEFGFWDNTNSAWLLRKDASNNWNIPNTLNVTGTSTAGSLSVTGTTTLQELSASNITASGTLKATGVTTLTTVTATGAISAVGLSSSSGLTVSSGATTVQGLTATSGQINGTLNVTGAIKGSSTLAAVGITSSNGLTVTSGATSLQGLTSTSLQVNGASTITGSLSAAGITSSNSLTVSSGTTTVQGLTASSALVNGNLTTASLNINGATSSTGNITTSQTLTAGYIVTSGTIQGSSLIATAGLTTGSITNNGNAVFNGSDYIRKYGNYATGSNNYQTNGLYIQGRSSSQYSNILHYESTGQFEGLNFYVLGGSTGSCFQMRNTGQLVVPGIGSFGGDIYAQNIHAGSTVFQTDGNITGSAWGGYLRNYMDNRFLQMSNLASALVNLGAGNIGTYAILHNNSGSYIGIGQVVAGSSLVYSSSGEYTAGGSPSGSWRCMGAANRGGGSDGDEATLYIRVS